jgi:prepilin-type N-terminal cleavage/methylation domain-containing protein
MERTFCQRDTPVAGGLVASRADHRTCPQHRASGEPKLHRNSTANRLKMPAPRYNDRGDTLIEILMAVVLIGVIFSAFVIALETNSTASTTHRNLVTADALLRDYAEGAKAAARTQCPTSTTYTTTTTSLPTGFSVANGNGFTGTTGQCPTGPATVQEADFTVTLPGGTKRTLAIDVRTP